MAKVLVTGGAGYIGSHACKALSEAGYEPVSLDSLERGHEWAVKWGPLEKGDLCNRPFIVEVLRKHRPQAVMHFAAYALVPESVANPALYYRNNVLGTFTLLEEMRAAEIGHFIFSSTCAIFGNPVQMPMNENHPKNPINPYGTSKLMIEKFLEDFDKAHGMRAIALRYFNAAGADGSGEIGELHDPETHLIPLVLDCAMGRRENVKIFGEDYETEDGTCIRDYIHVTDLAEAHVLALKALEKGSKTSFYNLGSENGFSVKEVIDVCREVTRHEIPAVKADRRPGDPPKLVADSALIKKELGFEWKHSSLEEIVSSAWNWHQKRRG